MEEFNINGVEATNELESLFLKNKPLEYAELLNHLVIIADKDDDYIRNNYQMIAKLNDFFLSCSKYGAR